MFHKKTLLFIPIKYCFYDHCDADAYRRCALDKERLN